MEVHRKQRFPLDRAVTAARYWEEMPIGKIHGRCRVINERGLGAQFAEQLYVGEVMRLELPPARGVYASVRYARGNYYGLGFLYVSERQEKAIRQICETCALEREAGRPK
jgi:hypothetical protein